MRIAIRGEGIAAYCCAGLLSRAGFPVSLHRSDQPRVPAIMLNDAALALIRDVFAEPSLFAGLPKIQRRVVAWGSEPTVLPHSGVVVSGELLLASLRAGLPPLEESNEDLADFQVLASRPLPPDLTDHRFGTRKASAAEVHLKDAADASACWIESLEEGWLFLIPSPAGANWLLAVGGQPEQLLESSRVIRPRIELLARWSGQFDAYPRIVSPVAGSDWLACGAAAMGFDPICGDGTAHAIREAILAAAVIRSIASGGDAGNALEHYSARLTAGFERHLKLCRDFYRTGGDSAWWRTELEALETGTSWCEQKARAHGEFRFRLDGFDLIPL